MNFEGIQAAIAAWVLSLLGWTAPADPVVWEDDVRPYDNGRIAILAWVAGATAGVDELRYLDNAAAAPAADLDVELNGCRVLTLQIGVEVLDQRPAAHARGCLETLRARLRAPASLAALDAANLGLVDAAQVARADYKADGRWVSRCVLDVRLNATAFYAAVDDATSSIAAVALRSDTLRSGDGADLPASGQMDEVIS